MAQVSSSRYILVLLTHGVYLLPLSARGWAAAGREAYQRLRLGRGSRHAHCRAGEAAAGEVGDHGGGRSRLGKLCQTDSGDQAAKRVHVRVDISRNPQTAESQHSKVSRNEWRKKEGGWSPV